MLHYQYGTAGYLDILKTGVLRGRMPNQLNDPLEFMPRHIDAHYYRLFIKEMSERFCLFSFTQDYLNYLMWSYYAQGHTGICIGYDFTSPAFYDIIKAGKKLFTIEENGIIEVKYDSLNRPIFDVEDLQRKGNRAGVDFLVELARNKGSHWSHEKEKRLLVPDGGDHPRSMNQRKGEFFYYNVGIESIREIWIGVRAKADTENKIEEIRSEFGGQYTVSRVELDPNTYTLKNKSEPSGR